MVCPVQVLYAEGGEGVAGSKAYAKVAEGMEAWTRVGEGETEAAGLLVSTGLATVLIECDVLLRRSF